VEFTLLWAALTAVAFVWAGARLWPEGLPDHPTDRMIGAAVAGLFIGRLTAMFVQGTNPLTNPSDILIVRGGVHTGAATIGAIVTYLWSVKGRIDYLDATAGAAILGLAGWHTGCLWREACLGTVSNLPWAWSQTGSAITRHPVEIYAAVGLIAAALLVSRLPHRLLLRSGGGLAAAGLIRLVTEPLRLSLTGGPVLWYAATVVVGVSLAFAGPFVAGRLNLRRFEAGS
jgi:hypothetical protein